MLHEQKADAAMREAVDEAADRAQRQKDDERRVAVLLAIMAAAQALRVRLGGVIADHRHEVRKASAVRLRAELSAAGVVAAVGQPAAATADHVYADAAAASLSAAWQAQAIAVTAKAESPYRAIDKTRLMMRPRIARTAATEMAHAYNDEHRASLERAIEKDPDLRQAIHEGRIVRVWDAVLDRRTCEGCDDRHGKAVDMGDEPPLHVNCRCIVTIESVSAALAA